MGSVALKKLTPRSAEVSKAVNVSAREIGKALAKDSDAEKRRAAESRIRAVLRDTIMKAASILAAGKQVSVHAEEEMITTQEAAELLNVSRPYVVKLIKSGELNAVKVGRYRRLSSAEVRRYKDAWMKKRESALNELAEISQKMGLGY